MKAVDVLWLILALVGAFGALGWGALEYIVLKRDWHRVEAERRSLSYQLMRACTGFEAERQDLQQALLRSRTKRMEAAEEIKSLKAGIEDALELLAAYRQFGGTMPSSMLASLRDDISQFGHLMEQEP